MDEREVRKTICKMGELGWIDLSKKYSPKEKAKILAELEVSWWKFHHYKDYDKVRQAMIKEYQLQFGLSYDLAEKAVELRVRAAMHHDEAEKAYDNGDKKRERIYWKQAEELLRQHFELIIR